MSDRNSFAVYSGASSAIFKAVDHLVSRGGQFFAPKIANDWIGYATLSSLVVFPMIVYGMAQEITVPASIPAAVKQCLCCDRNRDRDRST
ncbi:MAG: hypothetical protein KME42_16345 [Tildeniella nuda ZEHNDER 1965/U140]|nr:hypothetical protein [Tildeniella nuda ZEHNDER 1965/U140]